MSTPIVTPTPTPAPTASVATAQANVNNVITQVMPYLTTQFSQGIIAAVAALSNPNNPGIANGFNAITAATQAVATLPGSAGVYAGLAGFFESIIATVIGNFVRQGNSSAGKILAFIDGNNGTDPSKSDN